MVAKKKVTKKVAGKAIAKPTATSLADIKKEMAESVANIEDELGSTSALKIKINKNKTFTMPDGNIYEKIEVVILGFRSHNLYYDKPFVEGENAIPVCFAIGNDPKNMTPSPNAPKKQAKQCNIKKVSVCAYDEWGSRGKGKMCQNRRILAVVAPDAPPEADILQLSVSPTGLKRYDAYVKLVKLRWSMRPIGVITTVTFDPYSDHTSLVFGDPVDNPNLQAMWARQEEATAILESESQYL